MSVPATEAVGSTGLFMPTPTSTSGSTPDDKQMFMNLMVAQLRYQDPMNPADSGAFLAQSAQFTALEKMQAVADRTAELLSVQLAFGATSLVGQQVSYPGDNGELVTGTVDSCTFGAAGVMLQVGGEDVPLAVVQTVAVPGTPPPTVDPVPTDPTTDPVPAP